MRKIDFSQAVSFQTEAEDTARQQAIAYLSSTDWAVTRLSETGQPIPEDIAKERLEARAVLKSATSKSSVTATSGVRKVRVKKRER